MPGGESKYDDYEESKGGESKGDDDFASRKEQRMKRTELVEKVSFQ